MKTLAELSMLAAGRSENAYQWSKSA